MKKVLIISPHFPPVNAADMHRVRQSLPYFKEFGWKPTVLCVASEYVEMAKDELLLSSIPKNIVIHQVSAFSTKYTRKLGLGNLGLRAFYHLYKKGSQMLRNEDFDLIYFSTTVFASMPLGRLWKNKFQVPFIIDMQDPWRNDYYLTVAKNERPPKFWFAHRLNSVLEKYTMPEVDGLIAVTRGYIEILQERYPSIKNVPSKVLTFGAHKIDLEIASGLCDGDLEYTLDDSKINIIYAGAVPSNMMFVIESILKGLAQGMRDYPDFNDIAFHFIGTNYATGSRIKSAVKPLIKRFGLEKNVFEHEERIPYYHILKLIQNSKLAILPGTLDGNYTASKLYPYIMAKIPIIAIFHEKSSVLSILKELRYGKGISFNHHTDLDILPGKILIEIKQVLSEGQTNIDFNIELFKKFESKFMCEQQVNFFNQVLNNVSNMENE